MYEITGSMLQQTYTLTLGDYINLLNESITVNNQYMSPSNIYVTGDMY